MYGEATEARLAQLRRILLECESVCIGYSGGVDSVFLARISLDVLGADRVLAVTGLSPAYPAAQRRVALVVQEPELNRYRFIQKTALFKFVDELTVEFVEAGEGGSSLFLLSRSRVGKWDFGVNRRRIARWLEALRRRLQA